MNRKIKYFEFPNGNEDLHLEFEFSTYVLMMYYAAQLDYNNALKLFHATITEWNYRVEYELNEEGINSDNVTAHFVPSEIADSILFINNQLIPALIAEPLENIVDKYGGEVNFEATYNDNNTFLLFLGIYDEEYYGDKYEIIAFLKVIRNIFQESLNTNTPYHTWVW